VSSKVSFKPIPVEFMGVKYPSLGSLWRSVGRSNGVSEPTFWRRLKEGWSVEDAVLTEPLKQSKPVEYEGVVYPSYGAAWRALCGISSGVSYKTFMYRMGHGWSIGSALHTPLNAVKNFSICYRGKVYKTIKALAEECGIEYFKFYSRLRDGMSVEKAV